MARGVLSPYLFAVHVGEFSIQRGSVTVGCTQGNMIHLMFADDMSVFDPIVIGLQCLLNVSDDFETAENKIAFNGNKTIGMHFCPQK